MPRGACIVLAAALLAACAPMRLQSVWKDAEYREGPMQRIAVLVVEQDEAIRRYAEDEAVKSLPPAAGGVPGYRLFEKPERDIERVKARLAREGFDGALLARLVGTDRRKTWVPPQVHVVPGPFLGPPYYRSFYRYYPWAWDSVYTSPGYTVETTRTTAEVLVYALPGGRLVWSGILVAVDAESNAALLAGAVRAVRDPLARDGILPP
ncbi:MAG: hypothetical protein OHK0026_06700 [Rhodocyclaceae bacterium]